MRSRYYQAERLWYRFWLFLGVELRVTVDRLLAEHGYLAHLLCKKDWMAPQRRLILTAMSRLTPLVLYMVKMPEKLSELDGKLTCILR
ncbi:hypothetical protein ACT8ZS_23375 [Paenibacillus sp. M.A.Huq-84]